MCGQCQGTLVGSWHQALADQFLAYAVTQIRRQRQLGRPGYQQIVTGMQISRIRTLQVRKPGLSTVDHETVPAGAAEVDPGEGGGQHPLAHLALLLWAALYAALRQLTANVPDPPTIRPWVRGDGESGGHAEAVTDAVQVNGMGMRQRQGKHVQWAYLHGWLLLIHCREQGCIALAGAQDIALGMQCRRLCSGAKSQARDPAIRLHDGLCIGPEDAVAVRRRQLLYQGGGIDDEIGELIQCASQSVALEKVRIALWRGRFDASVQGLAAEEGLEAGAIAATRPHIEIGREHLAAAQIHIALPCQAAAPALWHPGNGTAGGAQHAVEGI